jgi:predicted nuclease of restriction endonuclease-like (RecB) superfamily
MKRKTKMEQPKPDQAIYTRIRNILESAQNQIVRSVNTTQVVANWLIGREIVEEEQRGQTKAKYGTKLLIALACRLRKEFGNGYSVDNLEFFRRFYRDYPALISDAVPRKFMAGTISDAVRRKSASLEPKPVRLADLITGTQGWKSGQLHPNLSWTHYRALLRVDKVEARAFYEIEAINNSWTARELERQIGSLFYERLALSRNPKRLRRLAMKGHEVQKPVDLFKDPVVMEFLGLPESHGLQETSLEQALINHLQSFLLELGRGFAFVARQQRLTLDGDHFYIDLVFYHTILKCYVVIDLKNGKLTHQDLGQLQLYVNYYDREKRSAGDGPTLGLILCTDKNDAVVQYTLGAEQRKTIFASRYKFHLPSEDELRTQLQREVRTLAVPSRKKS